MSRPQRAALIVTLLVAAALRLTGLDWDEFQHHHPDERYIAWVATTIEFPSPGSLSRADWQPETSTFNHFHWPPQAASEGLVVLQDEQRDFAYGHVPLYLGVLATRLVEQIGPALIPLLRRRDVPLFQPLAPYPGRAFLGLSRWLPDVGHDRFGGSALWFWITAVVYFVLVIGVVEGVLT